jgi:uncharacterized protein YigA (DUF484 family)
VNPSSPGTAGTPGALPAALSSSAAAPSGVQGITEQDIAQYLAHTPAFFERHAELLGSIQLTSPHGQRAVSLQERQMEMLRDRIRGLEARIVEMIRHGQENVAIADRLHRWTRTVLQVVDPALLPLRMVQELRHQFLIPQAAVRLWGVSPELSDEPFALGVSDDVRSFTASLTLPYCGVHAGFEAAGWLDDAPTVKSLALIPLRLDTGPDGAFGLLVLGSPDPTRYSADMGTEFLVRVGEIASAALARLRGTP